MKALKGGAVLLAAVLLITLLSGCGGSGRTETAAAPVLTPAAGEPAYAPQLTEGILLAIKNGDYDGYLQNCDEMMKTHTTAEYFGYLTGFIENKIGTYQSREFTEVQLKDQYKVVVYTARFTEEKEVKISISFTETGEDTALISGLWFDSPRLREQ